MMTTNDGQGQKKSPWISCFDFFRVVFTLYIVVTHVLSVYGKPNNLWMAVEFFFVMSGFLLRYNFHESESIVRIVIAKWLRFLPWIICGIVLMSFVRPWSWSLVSKDLFLASGTGFVEECTYNPPIWYLSVLFWMTLIFQLLFRICKRLWLPLMVFMVLISAIVLGVYGLAPQGGRIIGIPIRIFRGACEMGIGVIAAEFSLRSTAIRNCGTVLFSYVEIACMMAVFSMPVLPLNYFLYSVPYIGFCSLTVFVFSYQKGVVSKLISNKFMCLMARYSLPVFCTHYSVVVFLQTFIEEHAVYVDSHRAFLAMFSVVPCVLIGVFCSFLINRFVNVKELFRGADE